MSSLRRVDYSTFFEISNIHKTGGASCSHRQFPVVFLVLAKWRS